MASQSDLDGLMLGRRKQFLYTFFTGPFTAKKKTKKRNFFFLTCSAVYPSTVHDVGLLSPIVELNGASRNHDPTTQDNPQTLSWTVLRSNYFVSSELHLPTMSPQKRRLDN